MRQVHAIRLSCWTRLLALALLLGVGLLVSSQQASKSAHAQSAVTTTITDCSDDSQLQNAISNAASGDTIAFGCSGDILINITLRISKNLTLDGSGQQVTIDGGNHTQVLDVTSGVTFNLNALTIANGFNPYSLGGGLDMGNSTVTISNSTFANNSASGTFAFGGGIDNDRGTLTISNSTFSGNSVPGTNGSSGGAIENDVGTLTISNSTFSGNSASSGGGIDNSNGTVSIAGSIVANNTGGNCFGGVSDQGYNLSSDSSCGFSTANHDLVNTNPQLGSLANNGGPTQTLALLSGSPAIDAIPLSATICPSKDQRGDPRPDNGESMCDMGAYEFVDPADNDLGLNNMPADITTNATSAQGAVVTYTPPTVVDEDSPLPPVTCTPASGSTFVIGTTTVNCSVTDSDDTPSTVTGSFTVTVQPVLSATVSSVTATEGSSFSGVVATGTAYGTSNPLSATITWGDGSTSAGNVTLNSDGTYSVSGSHTYAEEGSYALSVVVNDSGSLSATANGTAKVADAALTMTLFAASSLPHHSAGVAATFSDADPAGTVSDYTATLSWGDGTTSTLKVLKNPLGNGFVLATTHTYAVKGTYSLTLTVTDQGGSQLSKTVSVTVK